MATVVWKLNGTSFAELGISGLKRTLVNLARDTCTFIAPGPIDSAQPAGLALGDTVVITREAGGVEKNWFRGRVTKVPRSGLGQSESLNYELSGPWWYLDNLVFQQVFPLNAAANSSHSSPSTNTRAAAIIGQSSAGGRRTNMEALGEVLDYAIAAGAPFDYDELPEGFHHPNIGLRAPSCAEAVRAALKWMPDAALRFDYGESAPMLSLVRRSTATPAELDLASGLVTELSIAPRPDLKVDHVVVQYVRPRDEDNYIVQTEVKDPPESTGLEFGSVVVAVPITSDLMIDEDIAENFRAGVATMPYEGQIVLEEAECSQTFRPGDVLNVMGGLAAWQTMAAQIQQVIEDVDNGRTTLIFGPPSHLAVQDLLTYFRNISRPSDAVDAGGGELLIAGRRDDEEGNKIPPQGGEGGSGGAPAWKLYQATVTLDGGAVVPTRANLIAAIEGVSFDGGPVEGDVINLLVAGTIKFRATLTETDPGDASSGIWALTLDLGGTWYAMVVQVGLY